jgi:succinyl-diaminopimelate desuccinylase
MDEIWPRVQRRIESYDQGMVDFQTEMTAVPALGPDNDGLGEMAKAEVVQRWLEPLRPDELFYVNAPDQRAESGLRPNLIAMFNGTGPGRVWVLAHIDIVPPGELSLWQSDPYTVHREGDKIVGRGVEDNQQGLVSAYFAVKALLDEGARPAMTVGLIAVSDEETGSKHGLQYLLEQRPDLFSSEDLILVPDAGSADGTLVQVAEKSMLWIKFRVMGRQCHASSPTRGVNSLRAAARIITAVDQALASEFDAHDPLFTHPTSTFEPTKKEANVPNVNTIPGEDVFYFDCRVLPRYDLDDVLNHARKAAESEARAAGAEVEVTAQYRNPAAGQTSPDSPVAQAVARAVRTVTGREPQIRGIGGGTVAKFFRDRGYPAVVWSTIADSAHAPNEHTYLSYLKQDAKVFAHVFMGG